MSVSDPLIKDIKGCVLQLHRDSLAAPIRDSSTSLLDFCQVFEKICSKSAKTERICFYGRRKQALFEWFFKIPALDNYSYENALDCVKKCRNVKTIEGKFRLLVRHCLAKKCLHYPLDILGDSRSTSIYYHSNAILGDEILSSILHSVLLQVDRINFSLNLDNSAFLDDTWLMPDLVRLEVVPCTTLGIAVSFSDDKAIIVEVKPDSVASETEEISLGDILDSLNGVTITSSNKGSLGGLVQKYKGPVKITILKGFHKSSNNLYPPIRKLLKDLDLEERLEAKYQRSYDLENNSEHKSGYLASFLGEVDVGDRGSTKEIEEAIKKFVQNSPHHLQEKIDVRLEINELSVKVWRDENAMFEHNFMEISSCGSAPFLINYLAYIVASKSDTKSKDHRFVCYIFHVSSCQVADKILKSIGHGFYRTQFAV